MPTSYQKKLIKEFEEACKEVAFMGTAQPDDHYHIEQNYEETKRRLFQHFDKLNKKG